jgi:hypothetical protein
MLQILKHPVSNIKFNYTSTDEIEKNVMTLLKTRHSHRHIEIYFKILKLSAPFVSSSLTYICNKSLSSGIIPTRLKFSIAKPVFKNGDIFAISNFRPVFINVFLQSFWKGYIGKSLSTYK